MNVAEHVERVARKTPKHPAIRFEGRTVTYEVLNACASALAGALRKKGVRRGDRVALYLPNIPAFMLAYLAVQKVGGIAVSINSIFKSEETKYILNDSGAKVVFTVAELLPNVPRRRVPLGQGTSSCARERAPMRNRSMTGSRSALPISGPRDMGAGRSGRAALFLRHHRVSQGRDPDAQQHRLQHPRRRRSIPATAPATGWRCSCRCFTSSRRTTS